MKLTTYTDFGLRALIYLACQPGDELSSISAVASAHQVSRNHMVKVLAQLAQLGLVRSIRGKNGGIRLAQAPEAINIGQVVRALEQNLKGIDCASPGCRLVGACALQGMLHEAMEAFLHTLEAYTLADLLGDETTRQTLCSLLRSPDREPAA